MERPSWIDQMAECLAVTGDTDTEQALLRQLIESARYAKELEAELEDRLQRMVQERNELEARIEKALKRHHPNYHGVCTECKHKSPCSVERDLRGEE